MRLGAGKEYDLPDELVKFEAGGVQGQVGHQVVDGVLVSVEKKLQLILLSVIRMFVVRLTVMASRPTDVINKFLIRIPNLYACWARECLYLAVLSGVPL